MQSSIIPYSGDQFGYYTVGTTFKTYSKLLAIEESRRTGHAVDWHFNRAQYSAYDWTQEPTESLDELYRIRAQQIRDNYDYIVVWYSGGPDSWCVLDSFLKNNIKIDEIGHCHSLAADGDKHSVFNEEIFYTAIPTTQKILETYPDIKHRVVDLSEIISKIYLRPDVKFDYIYNIKGITSANSLARSYMREYIDDYRRLMDSGKRVCFIWGTDKPRLNIIDGKYCTTFIDLFSETNLRLQSLSPNGYYDEWFFWAPDTAKIVAKQSHVLLKILNHETPNSMWFSGQTDRSGPQSRNTGKFLNSDIFHTMIYPGWNPATLVAPKPQNRLISERDQWFWRQNLATTESVRNAYGGLKELIKRIGIDWLSEPNDLTQGIKSCTNSYSLE